MDTLPNPFPIMRYHVHSIVERPMRLPEFAGSTLRGIFGHALREALCVTRQAECAACPLYRSCDYPAIFETPSPLGTQRIYSDIPNPYVIEPPPLGERVLKPGNPLDFSFVLIGPALARFQVIAAAWRSALRKPIGKDGGSADLRSIRTQDGQLVFDPARPVRVAHEQYLELPDLPAPCQSVTLEFRTPLNLRHRGAYLGPATISIHDLVRALIRRVADLVNLQLRQPLRLDYPALLDAADALAVDANLHAQGWSRYSNRQNRPMRIAGVGGSWRLSGDLAPLWHLLYLGQWLHVGKKSTFGLGHYMLTTTTGTSS